MVVVVVVVVVVLVLGVLVSKIQVRLAAVLATFEAKEAGAAVLARPESQWLIHLMIFFVR
jgi:hypothetical protein